MRVVAGSLRGRPIVAPEGEATRPTTDRAREATFNALVSLGAVEDAKVVDLFAGSGAMGIEALSRGAASCAFLERDRKALDSIRHNIKTLQLTDNTTVLSGDVMTNVVALRNVDLVLADPPYDFDRWIDLLSVLNLVLAPGGVVVTESGREIQPPEGWEAIRSKRYGRAWVAFLQRTDD
ncbi:MAG: 16S rRNA (guanine(966)-N(2))-methyltransferase RsmD [Actinomycetes bacterium]